MSLYSKYRPQNFANLVGQNHIRETLLHEIQQGILTHAYLFTGPRGTGKTSSARLIAKALNCEKKNAEGEPCDECDFCVSIKEGSLIDVMEVDAASNRGIDEIRELKEKIKFAPTRAKSKLYIIDEVHMLTKEAFNALLKTLEEPPENVYFILCTTEVHKIPETIISRCQRFDFKRIDVRTIMTRLSYIAQMENIAAEDTAIEMIARHVEGGLRDAIGLLEQMTIDGKILAENVRSHLGVTGFQTVETLTNLLEKHELQKAIHLINEVHNEGYDLTAFVRELLEHMREKMITGITQNNEIQQGLLVMIEAFEEARNMLRNTVIPQLPLEIAAIKICGSDSPMGSVAITENKEKPVATKIATKTEANEIKLEQNIEKDKAAVKEETEAAQEIKKQLETEAYKDGNIKQHWPRVLEHVNPASLRRSVSCSTVSEIDENTIKLMFNSRFHMEKAVKIEHKAAIEKAIEHLMGKKIKIVCEYSGPMEGEAVASIQDRDTAEKARSGKKVEKSAPAEPQKKADLADTVMGMFEGDGNSGW